VKSVNLYEVDPAFNGEEKVLAADLTAKEIEEANTLANAISTEVEALLKSELDWKPGKVDLHGLVVEPSKINALTGYADNGQGILVQLAKRQWTATAPVLAPAPEVSSAKAEAEVAAAKAACQNDFVGLRKVTAGLFAPKPRAGGSVNTERDAASK
jgi:hypothetical protein